MYRIELSPGEVTVFRTIEELATGVRNGVISPRARIFHGATQKWLPIEFHPHYKAALALLSGAAPTIPMPAAKPQERPSFDKLSFLNPQHAAVAPPAAASPEAGAEPEAGRAPDMVPTEAVETAAPSRPGTVTAAQRSTAGAEPTAASAEQAPAPSRGKESRWSEAGSQAGRSPRVGSPEARSPEVRSPEARSPEVGAVKAPHRPPRYGQRDEYEAKPTRAALPSPVELPYLVSPEDAGDSLTIDRDYNTPPPPARPRPASTVERERPEPVVEAAPSPVATGRGVPAAIAAMRASETAKAPHAHAPRAEAGYAGRARRRSVEPGVAHAHVTSRHSADAEAVPDPAGLPPVRTSPVLELPMIASPEFTPADAPVAEPRSAAGRRRRRLQVALALALLAVGGYGATLVLTPRSRGLAAADRAPERAPAERARLSTSAATAAPASNTPAAASPAAHSPASTSSRRAGATTAAEEPLPPASSGFAPALESRAIVKPAPPADSTTRAADSLPGVAPAPIDLSIPALTDPDSLVPQDHRQGDSTLKKILRAVNGGKELPSRP